MISITHIKNYCTDYQNIQNYAEAVKSPLRYDLHHRLEIDEMQSMSDLKFLHLYYHRPPEELIFLSHGDHISLHKKGKPSPWLGKHPSEETRKKMSEALKGEKSYMYGKPKSAETKQKISDARKGENNPMFGKHWHLEDGHRIWTD